jgi:cytochrome c553
MVRSNLFRILVPLALALSGSSLLVLANGCTHSGISVSADNQAFAGDAACERCHAKEFTAHRQTRHTGTMRDATRAGLGAMAPEPGEVPDSPYRVEEVSGKYALALRDSHGKPQPIQYSLGSGKTGLTFIEIDGEAVRQARMSYFPSVKKWYKTPGQTNGPPESLFKQTEGEKARRCVACHATGVDTGPIQPRPGFLGVGCEIVPRRGEEPRAGDGCG